MENASHIDPEELPFSTEEIFHAARLWLTADDARQMADHLAACAPGIIDDRRELRASLDRTGVASAHEEGLHGWAYPEWLLPALSTLSSSAESRVQAMMEREWAQKRVAFLYAERLKAAEAAGVRPTREEMLSELKQRGLVPRSRANVVVRDSVLPPPTAAAMLAAESRLEEEKHAWRALVAEARRRTYTRDR
jgi:hypothetical protein